MTHISWLSDLPKELMVFVMAMLPITELRGAIPVGLLVDPRLPIATTYIAAVLGNFVPVIPILLFLGPVSDFLRRVPIFDRFFTWLFARTRRRSKLVERYEEIGLTLFVAIPLPVTGAWTGALAAFIFGLRLKISAVCIAIGILIAGVVVTVASILAEKGVTSLLDFVS
jgi:uncharacterized membrane protein